jgi:hypothetical protein
MRRPSSPPAGEGSSINIIDIGYVHGEHFLEIRSPPPMISEVSLPCLQELTSSPHPQPHESTLFKFHFNITLRSTPIYEFVFLSNCPTAMYVLLISPLP